MQLTVYVDSGLTVDNPPDEVREALRGLFTIDNPVYKNAVDFGRKPPKGTEKTIKTFCEGEGSIRIPRGAFSELEASCPDGTELHYINKHIEKDTIFPPKFPMLWDYQERLVGDVMAENQGLILAPPGSGKTICGLALYSFLGQPCLWLTHTTKLANQSATRAKEFLGIEPGFYGAGKKDIQHFTVGIVDTLTNRDLSEIANEFGLVIVDEAHRVPANTFFNVVSQFPAKHRYGMTATPYRSDGLETFMYQCFGKVLTSIDRQYLRDIGRLMTPTVYLRETKFRFPYNPKSYKFNFLALQRKLPKDKGRNTLIASDVSQEALKGNICIVLITKLKHGEELLKLLKAKLKGSERKVGFVHSKLKPKELVQEEEAFESGETQVLIATYKMLAEGFDHKPANRLFLTAAIKDRTLIEQAIGRVERVCEGKEDAIVYDYVDSLVSVLADQAAERRIIYKEANNPVKKV